MINSKRPGDGYLHQIHRSTTIGHAKTGIRILVLGLLKVSGSLLGRANQTPSFGSMEFLGAEKLF
jgi:hypothetical protein